MQHMGAEYQSHEGITPAYFFRHMGLLHHTAAQGDQQMRLTTLQRLQGAHIAEHPVLCMLPHRAGVEQNKIRLFRRLCKTEAFP